MHAPLAAPPGPSERHLCPTSTEQALMHGLAKGLEGLLETKPVPPAPKLACCCSSDSIRRSASTVVRLPARPRQAIFTGAVNRFTEPRLVRR
jgi:hypothetical protein